MSAFGKLKLGVAAASVACLAAGVALAQQAAGQRNATQLRDDVPGRAATDQADRAAQPQRERIRSSTTTTQIGQRNTRTQSAGQNQEVDQFLAACLLEKNKCEIEFAKLAQQQSQNPQIKEFAQMLEQDHQKIVQQLEPLAGSQASQTSTRVESQTRVSATGQNEAQRQAADSTRLPGSSATDQATRQTHTAAYGSQEMSGPIGQLAQIEKQIGQRKKQAMLDELQQKSGAEFDKCYVGSQVGAHMEAVATLEVLSQQQGELAQAAQQALPTVQQHLDHAKQLAKQLEGGSQPGSQAERQRPRTQRQ
jgi:predicted outer membrane protein